MGANKQSMAMLYWHYSQVKRGHRNSPISVGGAIDKLGDLAGKANRLPWPRLENLVAKELHEVIQGTPRRKKSKGAAPTADIVPHPRSYVVPITHVTSSSSSSSSI